MASTSEIRKWWAAWECDTERYVRTPFPGPTQTWNLLVADASAPVWAAVGQIMSSTPYYFREPAGGTYACRNIGGSKSRSVHAYALALDLNPRANPHRAPLTHDYPASFITRMEGIRADGEQALQWGGRWTKPDAMHWQINVAPEDCGKVTWDKGEEMGQQDGPNGEPNWDEVSDWAQKAWSQAHLAGILTDSSHPRDSLEVEQLMVYLDRAKVI